MPIADPAAVAANFGNNVNNIPTAYATPAVIAAAFQAWTAPATAPAAPGSSPTPVLTPVSLAAIPGSLAVGNFVTDGRNPVAVLDIVDRVRTTFTFYEIKSSLQATIQGNADVAYYQGLTGYTPGTSYQSRDWVVENSPGALSITVHAEQADPGVVSHTVSSQAGLAAALAAGTVWAASKIAASLFPGSVRPTAF